MVKSPRKEIKFRLNINGKGLETSSLGLVFLCIIAVVGFGAVNTGNNLLYLLFSSLLSLLFLSAIYAGIGLSGIEASMEFPGEAFAGEPVVIRSTLTNKKRLFPSLGLSVNAGRPRKSLVRLSFLFPFLLPLQTKTQRKIIRFAQRGEYSCQKLFIDTDYPFGFFKKFRTCPCGRQLVVYPSTVPIPSLEAFIESWEAGQSKGGREEREGDSFFGVKEFFPGDDYRRIHWKVSAKKDRLMVKEYQRDRYDKVEICLDRFLPSPADENVKKKFEYLVSGATTLILKCLSQGIPVVLAVPESGLRRPSFYETREEMLYQLATVKPVKNAQAYDEWKTVRDCALFFTLNEPQRLKKYIPENFRIVICREKRFMIR